LSGIVGHLQKYQALKKTGWKQLSSKKDKNQNIIWTSVIDQQVNNEKRNQIIIDLCQKYFDVSCTIFLAKQNFKVCVIDISVSSVVCSKWPTIFLSS